MYSSTFRLQYASDLHLEFYDSKIPSERFLNPVAEYLALCGDIGFPEDASLRRFLSWCSANFKEVYWLPGNHEFYAEKKGNNGTYDDKIQRCDSLCKSFPNVYFMNRVSRTVPGTRVRIAGCTMWTLIEPENDGKVMQGMNDVRQIYITDTLEAKTNTNANAKARPDDFRRWHLQDKTWLINEIEETKKASENLIVLTHHLPSYKLIDAKYEGHPLNFCFASNLEYMMKSPIRAWLCGHSHTAHTVEVNGVHCSLNPFGYPGEGGSGFSSEKVLEITYYDEFVYDSPV